MKKCLASILFAVLLLSACGTNPKPDSPYVRVEGDSLIVNTSIPGASIQGYKGPVPLEVVLVKGRIADIRVLDNEETPRFLARALYGLKDEWIGKSVSKAAAVRPDAVSGATYTSRAIISNMEIALAELQK